MKTLSKNFLHELMKMCLRKTRVFELAKKHILYHYLPSEEYKLIWQCMCNYYENTSKLITIGTLTQSLSDNAAVVSIINEIKNCDTIDDNDLFEQLEIFIKNKKFIEVYDKLGDLYNSGKKEEVFTLITDISDQFTKFKLLDSDTHTRVIENIIDRYNHRQQENHLHKGDAKIPTTITPLDYSIYGGLSRSDTLLLMADSGVGKSKFLKYLGIGCARLGGKVVHIQAEGTEKEAIDAYDAGILGKNIIQVENSDLSADELTSLSTAVEQIKFQQGEIFLIAFEKFDTGTMKDVHEYCQRVVDLHGHIDLLIVDYIDEVDPGDNKKYSTSNDGERRRRSSSAKKFKNICVEFNCAGATATQSATRPPSEVNDPNMVLTRYNISEFKGLLQSFSIFLTLNQTADEYDNRCMRIYIDKFRKHRPKQKLIHICTNYQHERFYDHKRTVNAFGLQQ